MAATWGLALHTAGSQLGLALGCRATEPRWQVWDLDRELSVQLHVRLAAFLSPQTWEELAFIAAVRGPGSFTSTRVGVVAARTLAQQLEVPLFGISTLAAAARMVQREGRTGCVAVSMPARRQQLFGAVYELLPAQLVLRLPEAAFSAAAWTAARDRLTGAPVAELELPAPRGADVVGAFELAYQGWQAGERPHWSEVVPFYGQHPIEPS